MASRLRPLHMIRLAPSGYWDVRPGQRKVAAGVCAGVYYGTTYYGTFAFSRAQLAALRKGEAVPLWARNICPRRARKAR